ncbi:hypothetical protein BGV16_18500 [Clostridioides difficile]|uniref:hypothetical protein n=1 Tax=Clostridioides difficile TaxID=1496 RepID=UPI000BD8F727|nr:hypothetical protein [Clostridioides difficile]PBF79323.1 hypothetical protein BGV16_18500 [Clostridioides difficile]
MAKNTKQTTVHIDETLLKEVKRIGINENKSISQIINESIIDYILVYWSLIKTKNPSKPSRTPIAIFALKNKTRLDIT